MLFYGITCAVAQDFDPFDAATPLDKAEQAYKDAIKQRDSEKDADAREKMKPYLRALKEHLIGRGSKIDDKGSIQGGGTPVAGGGKKHDEAWQGGKAMDDQADNTPQGRFRKRGAI